MTIDQSKMMFSRVSVAICLRCVAGLAIVLAAGTGMPSQRAWAHQLSARKQHIDRTRLYRSTSALNEDHPLIRLYNQHQELLSRGEQLGWSPIEHVQRQLGRAPQAEDLIHARDTYHRDVVDWHERLRLYGEKVQGQRDQGPVDATHVEQQELYRLMMEDARHHLFDSTISKNFADAIELLNLREVHRAREAAEQQSAAQTGSETEAEPSTEPDESPGPDERDQAIANLKQQIHWLVTKNRELSSTNEGLELDLSILKDDMQRLPTFPELAKALFAGSVNIGDEEITYAIMNMIQGVAHLSDPENVTLSLDQLKTKHTTLERAFLLMDQLRTSPLVDAKDMTALDRILDSILTLEDATQKALIDAQGDQSVSDSRQGEATTGHQPNITSTPTTPSTDGDRSQAPQETNNKAPTTPSRQPKFSVLVRPLPAEGTFHHKVVEVTRDGEDGARQALLEYLGSMRDDLLNQRNLGREVPGILPAVSLPIDSLLGKAGMTALEFIEQLLVNPAQNGHQSADAQLLAGFTLDRDAYIESVENITATVMQKLLGFQSLTYDQLVRQLLINSNRVFHPSSIADLMSIGWVTDNDPIPLEEAVRSQAGQLAAAQYANKTGPLLQKRGAVFLKTADLLLRNLSNAPTAQQNAAFDQFRRLGAHPLLTSLFELVDPYEFWNKGEPQKRSDKRQNEDKRHLSVMLKGIATLAPSDLPEPLALNHILDIMAHIAMPIIDREAKTLGEISVFGSPLVYQEQLADPNEPLALLRKGSDLAHAQYMRDVLHLPDPTLTAF